MAQTGVGYLDLTHITGITGGDLEMNSVTSPRTFAPYQPVWMKDTLGGMRLFTLIQNRGTDFARGMVISSVGDTNGITIVTASTSTTTSVVHSLAALTTNQHVGALVYPGGNAATAATESEMGVIVSNSSTTLNLDSRYPFSAALVASQFVNVIGTYNAEVAVGQNSADTQTTILGVVIGQNGIDTGNFGFVQSIGKCPRVLKNTTASNALMTARGYVVVASAGSGVILLATTGTGFQLSIGQTLAVTSSAATEAAVHLYCHQMPAPYSGTTGAIA